MRMSVLVVSLGFEIQAPTRPNFGVNVQSIFSRCSNRKMKRILTNSFPTTTWAHVTNNKSMFPPLSGDVVGEIQERKKCASSKFMSPSRSEFFVHFTRSRKIDVSESLRLREKDVFGNVHVSIMSNKAESKK